MKNDTNFETNIKNAEEISKKIRQDCASQTSEILDRAKQEAQKILAEALWQAQENKKRQLADLDKQVQVIKEKTFSALNLEKRRITLAEKEKFIQEVLSTVKKEASAFRSQPDYLVFLKNAIAECAGVIDEKNLVIYYSHADEKNINSGFKKEVENFCSRNLNQEVSIEFKKGDFEDLGIIAQSKDSRLLYDNTFSSRVKRVYDEIYMDLLRAI
jgi:vacuolar-type H+-ATPase subunit E/Vma4